MPPDPSHEARASTYIRRRRVTRILLVALLTALTASAIAANIHHRSDDWTRFNHRQFMVTAAPAADVIHIRDGEVDASVQLLGVTAPRGQEHAADIARAYTTNRLLGKRVTLLLEPPQTRDASGNILAFVYPIDVDNLNIDIVKDGLAYADPRSTTLLKPAIEQAEREARKKSRGLWKGLNEAGMPPWRREWLREFRARNPWPTP